MTILALESSTNVCSAAVTVGGMPIATRISRDGGNHSKLLPVFVDELLAEIRAKGLMLEAVALSEGPGSYTGLRIGTSLAKGLCYGCDIPLYSISTPQVLCAAAAAQFPIDTDEILCPMIDARRMEVYTGAYNAQLLNVRAIEAKIIDENSFADILSNQKMVFFGDGAAKCASVIKYANARFIDGIVPDAQYMGLLVENGLGRLVEGKDIAYYDPMYLKEFVAAPSHVKGLK